MQKFRRLAVAVLCLLVSFNVSLMRGAQSTQAPVRRRSQTKAPTPSTNKSAHRSPTRSGQTPAVVEAGAPISAADSLSSVMKPRLVLQLGHATFLNGFATFSPDNRLVATGSDGDGGSVIIWDVATGREVRRLAGNTGDLGAQDSQWLWGAFSPDARIFAAGDGPNLRLWDIKTGKLLRKIANEFNFDPTNDAPAPLAFSPDGRQLILKGGGDKFTLDAATGRILNRVRAKAGHSPAVPATILSPGGRLRATVAEGGIDLTENASGRKLQQLRFASDNDSVESTNVFAYAVSPDERMLITVNGEVDDFHIRLWNVQTGKVLRRLEGVQSERSPFRFTADGELLSVTTAGTTIYVREMVSGRQSAWEFGGDEDVEWKEISPDGRLLVTTAGRVGKVWDVRTGAELARVEAKLEKGADEANFSWDFAGFTPDETVTFLKSSKQENVEDQRFRLSIRDWKEKQVNGLPTMPYTIERGVLNKGFVLTADMRAAAWETDNIIEGEPENTKWLTVWNADPKIKNKRFQIDRDEAYGDPSAIALSPDGRRALVATSNSGASLAQDSIKVWDADTKRALFKLSAPGFRVGTALAWSPDARMLATGADDGTVKLWDATNGRELKKLAGHADSVQEVNFSPDSRRLITYSADGFTRLFDVASGAEICRFMARDDESWFVVDPQGRFDTNNLDEIRGVHWIAPDDPLKPLPLEIFMREYYEPRLLARLLAGEQLKPVRSLADLNRVQPQVKITGIVSQPEHPELVNVTVEVSKAAGELRQGAQGEKQETGVYDLRLFRDGQLVGQSPTSDSTSAPATTGDSAERDELRAWQESTRVKLDEQGKQTVTFSNVRLPRSADTKELEFSAYAFNEDRIKSATDRRTFSIPAGLSAVKRRAYVISVGVNAYENPAWDLRFAANDAHRLQDVLAHRISQAGIYQEIVRVPLISDYEFKDGRKTEPRVLTQSQATKRNFQTVLELLSGKHVDAALLKEIPNAEQLQQATPEDLVIISFSSHGYADARGNFFLVPFDTGTGAGREMREVLRHCISSDELSLWLRDVDAGEMVLVVDACHSAASIQGEGFKPGPMGSRGLGQLSYDKGMRILTSTQADNVALESKLIEQGLLTYVLTHDGIESNRADFKPQDKTITVSEWLAYGVERVPVLYDEVEKRLAQIHAGQTQTVGALGEAGAQAKVIILSPADGSLKPNDALQGENGAKNLKLTGETVKTQQPALFDFARKRREVTLVKTQ